MAVGLVVVVVVGAADELDEGGGEEPAGVAGAKPKLGPLASKIP